ncbi:MAG TPA: hypothetical protein VL326_11120 [Kofleriaceae bacterium]|nr:hypothetical protein [Kofleriaceae bacterium]
MRQLLVLSTLAIASSARAEDRLTMGYVASRPIAPSGSGIAHAMMVRWDHPFRPRVEILFGLEVGVSGGEQPIARFAALPGIAIDIAKDLRLEEQVGWQIVRGRLTLDGIPLRGTETRGWHDELALAFDRPLTDLVTLRLRGGMVIDGIYPSGHASTRFGPFVGFSFAIAAN